MPVDCGGTDVSALPGAFRARKRPGPVEVVFAAAPGRLETLEGPVAFEPGDALLTGRAGERWPVRPERFAQSYRPVPPVRMGENGRYEKLPVEVWATAMPRAFRVRIRPDGDVLTGKPGDFLVQYGPAEYAVVDALIFAQTYEIMDNADT